MIICRVTACVDGGGLHFPVVEGVEEHLGQKSCHLLFTLGPMTKLVGYKVGDSLEEGMVAGRKGRRGKE